MSRIIERALSIINDNLKDQTTSFADPISIKPMARGGDVKGRLLQDEYPTHYLPHVGRQVMADGGAPVKGFEGRVIAPAPIEETPDVNQDQIQQASENRARRFAGKAWDVMSPEQRQQFMSYPDKGLGGVPISEADPQELLRQERAIEMGHHGPWYHGSERIDRVVENNKIDPKRATSGPMPFFTDAPTLASGYAEGKKDTSLSRDDTGDVSNYFTVKAKDLGLRSKADIPVERAWHFLPSDIQKEISGKALRIGYENPEEASGDLKLHPEGINGSIAGEDHYNYILKREAQGNPLKALRILWHDSGTLFNEENRLEDIFKLAGFPHEISQKNAPWTEAKGVLPAMLRIEKPLVTHNVEELNEKVIPHLEQAFAKDRTRKKQYGADQWDKNTRYTPKEWVAQLKEDMAKGDNSYVWTSIPDKITNQLKVLGYDGIIDTGGKGGGQEHRVAIPFYPHQVRSVFAKFNPEDKMSEDITKAEGGDVTAYHGSSHEFEMPDEKYSQTAAYHYLADNPETAKGYGKNVYRAKIAPKNMISFDPENITQKHMKVINELAERLGEDSDHLHEIITSADGRFYGSKGSIQDQVMHELKDMGFDAVRFPDPALGGGWDMSTVILDPSIIKKFNKSEYAIGGTIPHLERASDMIDTHDDIQLAPGVEAIDEMPNQEFTSADTSRNQIPALFNHPALKNKKGARNIDIGGGKFDRGTQHLFDEHGIESKVLDPFNRSDEHNAAVADEFEKNPADMATVANVLNVIKEPHYRQQVIQNAHKYLKDNGEVYFSFYEGDGTGNSRMTRDGWQENRKTASYLPEIKKVFPTAKVVGKTIIASKKPAKAYGGSIPGPKLTEENADDFARRLIAWTFATAPLFQRAAGGSVIDDPLDVLSKLRR